MDTLRASSSQRFLSLLPALALAFCCAAAPGPTPTPVLFLVEEMPQMRCNIIECAQDFVGLKYRYAGISPTTGFDCSGFTSYIMREFSVNISSSSANQSRQGVKIDLKDVQPGDLIFFGKKGKKGRIQHVAMVVERTPEGIICVHSTNSRGIVVENVSTSKYWRPRLLFARDVLSPLTRPAAKTAPQAAPPAPSPAPAVAAAAKPAADDCAGEQ